MKNVLQGFWIKSNRIIYLLFFELSILVVLNFLDLNLFISVLVTIMGLLVVPSLLADSKNANRSLLIPVITLLIYLFSTILIGKLNGEIIYKQFTVVSLIFAALSLISALVIGYGLLGFFKKNMAKILAFILIIISILILFSYLISLYAYGRIFHLLSNASYSEGGIYYYLKNEVKWIFGLSIKEVTPNYIGAYICVAVLPICALFFKKKDTENNYFFWIIIYAAIIALIPVLFYPMIKTAIVILIATLSFLLMIFFPKTKKQRIKFWILISAGILIYALLLLLYKLDVSIVVNLINKLGPLRRIFDLTIFEAETVKKSIEVLKEAIKHPFGGNAFVQTNNLILDTLNQVGIIPTIALLILIIVSVRKCYCYYKYNTDSKAIKLVIIAIIWAYFINSLLNYEQTPLIKYNYYAPIAFDPLFFITLMLIGYCTFSRKNNENN